MGDIQEVERRLKIQQEGTQVEKSCRNPYTTGQERFKLISSMFDMVMNQMNVINTCFTVHARIAFTEEDKKNLSKDITQIPHQLSEILLESAIVRNNLIEIIGAMEQLSNGIARFVKIANNQKLQDKPLEKFLHFVEKPEKNLKVLLEKTCELDTQKVAMLGKNLAIFMEISGFQTIPGWIKEQAQCIKDLETLEKDRQRKFIEDIAEYDEMASIISEIEFYQTILEGGEHLKKDLQNEKEILQSDRDHLESQALEFATSNSFLKFFRSNYLNVLRNQKTFIKQEISDIAIQEVQKISYEAECKKMLTSLSEKLKLAKEKVEKAMSNREEDLKKIDSEIKEKQREVKQFEEQILQMLKKYGNPSFNATCLLLESIAKLAEQRTKGTGVSNLYLKDVGTFLKEIESEIDYIRDVDGNRDVLNDEWIRTFETSVDPLNFFTTEIRPIIRNSIHGISPEGYSAGKTLGSDFNSNLRIED